MGDSGYMDAAAVPVPDARDDTLYLAETATEVIWHAEGVGSIEREDAEELGRDIRDALLPLIHEHVAATLRDAAGRWRLFVADGRCPTCQMATRETKGMICQTCGTDYAGGDTP